MYQYSMLTRQSSEDDSGLKIGTLDHETYTLTIGYCLSGGEVKDLDYKTTDFCVPVNFSLGSRKRETSIHD